MGGKFKFFQYGSTRLFKKANADKFHEVTVDCWVQPSQKFKEFLVVRECSEREKETTAFKIKIFPDLHGTKWHCMYI